MLIGEYRHALDPKKRLAIPAKLRREIGEKVVLTRGLENCLFVFSMKEWEMLAERASQSSIGQKEMRGFTRLLLSGASEVELDALGRVLVPEYLRDYAGLQKNTIVVGVGKRLEVWDEKKWTVYKQGIESNYESYASSFT